MTRRKARPFRTEAELETLLSVTPAWDPTRQTIELSLAYRRNPAMRLDRINRARRMRGTPEASSLDDVQRRLERA